MFPAPSHVRDKRPTRRRRPAPARSCTRAVWSFRPGLERLSFVVLYQLSIVTVAPCHHLIGSDLLESRLARLLFLVCIVYNSSN